MTQHTLLFLFYPHYILIKQVAPPAHTKHLHHHLITGGNAVGAAGLTMCYLLLMSHIHKLILQILLLTGL